MSTAALSLPAPAAIVGLLDCGTLRFATAPAAPNGYACYLTPRCPLWMGCDCPPYQGLSQRPHQH